MHADALKKLLETRLPECEFIVRGDDGKHFQVIAVGEVFAEITSPVKKQQFVMAQLKEELANDTVHAVSLKTLTPAQWAEQKDRLVG